MSERVSGAPLATLMSCCKVACVPRVSRLLLRVVRSAMGTEEVCILSGTRAPLKAALASATIAMNVRTLLAQGSSSAGPVGETLAATVSGAECTMREL